MKRKRRTKNEILKGIIKTLSKKELSINEIATKIKANWSTVSSTLSFMKQLQLVEETITTHKIRIFKLTKKGKDLAK